MTHQDQLEAARAWRTVFLNDDGTLKPDAEYVLRDLESICDWMKTGLPQDNNGTVDPLKLAAGQGKRLVFATVKARLFGDLKRLKRMIENG